MHALPDAGQYELPEFSREGGGGPAASGLGWVGLINGENHVWMCGLFTALSHVHADRIPASVFGWSICTVCTVQPSVRWYFWGGICMYKTYCTVCILRIWMYVLSTSFGPDRLLMQGDCRQLQAWVRWGWIELGGVFVTDLVSYPSLLSAWFQSSWPFIGLKLVRAQLMTSWMGDHRAAVGMGGSSRSSGVRHPPSPEWKQVLRFEMAVISIWDPWVPHELTRAHTSSPTVGRTDAVPIRFASHDGIATGPRRASGCENGVRELQPKGRARYCLPAYRYRTEYRACHPHVPSTVPVLLFRPCVPYLCVQGMATRILPAYLASMRLVMHAQLICIASLPNFAISCRGGEGPGEVPVRCEVDREIWKQRTLT